MAPDRDHPKGWHSRGYLPHFDSPEMVQHLVFRTRDSLPPAALDALPRDPASRRAAVDALLDASPHGRDLADPSIAHIVEQAMLHFDGVRYALIAWCVMPNHVHALARQLEPRRLGDVVGSWKRFTANRINRLRATGGAFWAADYFDRYMRDEDHLLRTVEYIEMNPVKAGLVRDAAAWPFSSARRR